MSYHHLSFPLVEQGPNEEAVPGTFGAAAPLQFLPPLKNYASDEKTLAFFQNEVWPIMDQTRRDRQTLELEWEDIRNMNMMKHDAGRRYFGRSDVYLPIYKRERSKLVSMLSHGLFPSDEYFDVTDRGTGDPERAKPVKHYMQWELETNARARSFIKPALSSLVDYGTAVNKIWYRKKLVREGSFKPGMFPGSGQYGFKPYKHEGLAISPRNLLFWHIYPMTAESLDDAIMVFEDINVPYSYLAEMKALKRWENVDEVIGYWENPSHERARLEMLASRGLPNASTTARSFGKLGLMYTVTEAWLQMVLPRDAYLEDEDPSTPIPVRAVMVNHIPVEVRRNPFFHQRPPYAVSRIDWEPGVFYGDAYGRVIRPLQILANDFMNQTNDNGIMSLNPITLVDPSKMVGPPRPFAPGVPWYVSDVQNAVKFITPPIEQVPLGLQMTQLVIGLSQDMGGAPPDRGSRAAGAKTATGMQVMQRNAMIPLQDVVEDIEQDGMVPILQQGWKNAIQYRDEQVMASVAGEPVAINPEDLAIDAEFRWLASSQAMNNQVRTQQAMTLIQMVAPLVPLLMQQGYIVDFVALVRRVYADGMGFRGFNEFIRRAEAVPQDGMPRPDQMGGVQAEQQDRFRSALEQIGGGGEAVPGEAEDFMQVRQNADMMAGLMGGGNGGGGLV
jgi:hypothetical protein